MDFSLIMVLLVMVIHTRPTNKLKRAKKLQKKGEFVLIEDSDSEWNAMEEDETPPPSHKSAKRTKTPSKAKAELSDKGKRPMLPVHTSTKRKRLAKRNFGSVETKIAEPVAQEVTPPVDHVFLYTERTRAFEQRKCIGERHVNIEALCSRSSEFGVLIHDANLLNICRFPETSSFCLHLTRTFYSYASRLQQDDDGHMQFYTMVRGVEMKITPHVIGEVLGMEVTTSGTYFLKGIILTETIWNTVVEEICLPNTQSVGHTIRAKFLKMEYRFLHYIVCYNIMPNMNTKILRWDRMLFLYLLGHSEPSPSCNFNIPFLIWSRMARYVEGTHPSERLPFPLIIMRILTKFRIDTGSTSYLHNLGTINDSTVVKSLSTKQDDAPSPPRSKRAATAGQSSRTAGSSPDDSLSVNSICQRISSEQERMSNEFQAEIANLKKSQSTLTKLVKKVLRKLGCSSSEDSD